MGTTILIMVIIFVIVITIHVMNDSASNSKVTACLSAIDGFTADQIKRTGLSGIAIDEKRSKICFFDANTSPATISIINHTDLMSSEILEGGDSITKTSRTSQAGSAVIGGLLLGGLGAVVGGLSGSKKTTQKINDITLRIAINDTKKPVHSIVFLNSETNRKSPLHTAAADAAKHWHTLLEILIKRADDEDKAKYQNHIKSASFSKADELLKLVNLRDSGVLTNDEFDTQKSKLLNS